MDISAITQKDSEFFLGQRIKFNDNNVVIYFPCNKTGFAGWFALQHELRNVDKATERDIYMVCNKSAGIRGNINKYFVFELCPTNDMRITERMCT